MTTRDRLAGLSDSPNGSALRSDALVPHDTNPLPRLPKGIYVGTGGDVVLRAIGSDADVTYKNLGNGSYIAVRASHVRATGTTASNMILES